MLPDGPPVPKNISIKELIKPKIIFGFLFHYIYNQPHAAAQYSFGFFKYFKPNNYLQKYC
jgi:hypothetical protein